MSVNRIESRSSRKAGDKAALSRKAGDKAALREPVENRPSVGSSPILEWRPSTSAPCDTPGV